MYYNGQILYDLNKDKLIKIKGKRDSVFCDSDPKGYAMLIDKQGGMYSGRDDTIENVERLIQAGRLIISKTKKFSDYQNL